MALNMQTIAFLMNYVNDKINSSGLSGEDIHVSSGSINEENGKLILTYNTNKQPIEIDLSGLITTSPDLSKEVVSIVEQNINTIIDNTSTAEGEQENPLDAGEL